MRLLTVLCLLGGSLRATPVLIAHACSGSPTGSFAPSVTTLTTTGANFIVIVSADYQGSGVGVTDSLSNTWVLLTQKLTAASSVNMWYSVNPAVGSGQTFSVAGNYNGACVLAWSNVAGGSPADGTGNGNFQTSTTVRPGSITTTVAGDLVISGTSFGVNGTSDSATIDSSFTISDSLQGINNQNVPCFVAWKIQSAAAAIDVQWSGASSTARTAIVGAFKAATASTGGNVHHGVINQ